MSFESDRCAHDFRRLYPRHVLGFVPTGVELPLGFVCCRCGKGPGHVLPKIEGWRTIFRGRAGAFLPWPEDLKITDYEMEDRHREDLFITVSFEGEHDEDRN